VTSMLAWRGGSPIAVHLMRAIRLSECVMRLAPGNAMSATEALTATVCLPEIVARLCRSQGAETRLRSGRMPDEPDAYLNAHRTSLDPLANAIYRLYSSRRAAAATGAAPAVHEAMNVSDDKAASAPVGETVRGAIFDLNRWRSLLLACRVELDLDRLDAVLRKVYLASESAWSGGASNPSLPLETAISPLKGAATYLGVRNVQVVRRRLKSYAAGEISHIENILPKEDFGRSILQEVRSESEDEKTLATSESTDEKSSSKTAETFANEAATSASARLSVSGSVRVAGGGAGFTVEAAASAGYESTTESSTNVARNTAKEITEEAANRVAKDTTVRQLKRESRLYRDRVHRGVVNNDQPVTAIYRWVNEVHECQVIETDKHPMLEIFVPEPAALYRFLQKNRRAETERMVKAPTLATTGQPLSPADLHELNYMIFVTAYGADGVEPPPAMFATISQAVKAQAKRAGSGASQSGSTTSSTEKAIHTIPVGYEAYAFACQVAYDLETDMSTASTAVAMMLGANNTQDNLRRVLSAQLMVGPSWLSLFPYVAKDQGDAVGAGPAPSWPSHGPDLRKDFDSYTGKERGTAELTRPADPAAGPLQVVWFDRPLQGAVQTVLIAPISGLDIAVSTQVLLLCRRTDAGMQAWQLQTWTAIMDAYRRSKEDAERAAAAAALAARKVSGSNPLQSEEAIRTELKRLSISVLTAQHLDGFGSVIDTGGAPTVDFSALSEQQFFVQLFEQGLLWQEMSWVFYPYFWANQERWASLNEGPGTDANLSAFLRAGAARINVPVRGVDWLSRVAFFTDFRISWGLELGEAPSAVAEEELKSLPYLNLIDELKEQLKHDFRDRAGWAVVSDADRRVLQFEYDANTEDDANTVKPPLVGADDIHREVRVDGETYLILDIDAEGRATVDPPLRADPSRYRFATGGKRIGLPWDITLPTELTIFNTAVSELPSFG